MSGGLELKGLGSEGWGFEVWDWSQGLGPGGWGQGGVKTQTTVTKRYAQIWQNFWLP